MKTTRMIVYSGLATVVLACFALSAMAQADCRQGCDLTYFNTFLGNLALKSNTTGTENTAIGDQALFSNTYGNYNTATGAGTLFFNTTGNSNTATGAEALEFNGTGNNNTANGDHALFRNTTGNNNNAFGFQALVSNNGSFNNAFGNGALAANTTGNRNTAMGEGAMVASSTGSQNTAVGVSALRNNSTGFGNIAIGQDACNQNGSASYNTGVGWQALFVNTANFNTATGADALVINTTGNHNTATGVDALYSNTTGSSNVGIGVNAGRDLTTGNGNVCIGVNVFGVAGESNTTRIRNVYSSMASGRAVYVNSGNKIGTLASSRRFKEEIRPMEKASESILALKPVSFRYKKQIDAKGTKQFGLVAEEVEKVNPDLVTCDEEGKPESVRYEAINAMLLNEFVKEHRKVEEQQVRITELNSKVAKQDAIIDQQRHDFQAAIAEQQTQIAALASSLKDQASQLQKVTTQLATGRVRPVDGLELSKASPRTVLNDQ